MNFVQSNKSVQCIRTHQKHGKEISELIVSFDEQLATIAPHVSALLSAKEISQLDAWLIERNKLQLALEDKPLGITVLEALPGLLQEAADAVSHLEQLDASLYRQIKQSLSLFNTALEGAIRSGDINQLTEFDTMQDEEILKEQLNSIHSKV